MSYDLSTHARKFAPVYGEHDFSDHLPMAVTALRALKVDEKRITQFAKKYAKRLKRKKIGDKTIDAALLSARISDPTVYPQAFNYFLNAIESEGRAQVLAAWLPELTPAIATAAFHGVLRAAYGLQANENAEIAAGLAYWWSRASTISAGTSIGAANSNIETLIDDLAAAIKQQGRKLKLDQPTISERIAAVATHPKIGAVLGRAMSAEPSFDAIAATALRMYLASEDFTALHCVTGVHAARIIIEHVVMDDAEIRKALWVALCAAYASIGAPALGPLAPPPSGGADWQVIASAASSSDDEHDVKFVYSCIEEARKYGRDAHYRYAASLRLGLIDG